MFQMDTPITYKDSEAILYSVRFKMCGKVTIWERFERDCLRGQGVQQRLLPSKSTVGRGLKLVQL